MSLFVFLLLYFYDSLLPKPKNEYKKISLDEDTGSKEAQDRQQEQSLTTTVAEPKRDLSLVKKTLPLDEDGKKNYDLIARVGHSADRQVQTRLADTKGKKDLFTPEDLARPSADAVAQETEEAKRALELLVMERTAKTRPKNFVAVNAAASSNIIRYQSKEEGAPERLIKMVEMPKDPLEPPKFHHKRIPRAPPSPPAPRLHSPPRKVTPEEYKAWTIPPCISSWKNPKGYTVPLDKRLAADGKGLQEKTINSRVADMAEALFLAEKHNREEMEMRAAVERKVAEQEQKQKEEQLRRMAEQAREEARRAKMEIERAAREEEAELRRRGIDSQQYGMTIRERERLREEMAYERKRELRLSKMTAEQRSRFLAHEENRDISEKVALGQVAATGDQGGEAIFDERLFDRNQGMDSGFFAGDDEVYNLYDKPLMSNLSHLIYRPALRGDRDEGDSGDAEGIQVGPPTKLSKPDKAFLGADIMSAKEGPVQFERGDTISLSAQAASTNKTPGLSIPKTANKTDDPFGVGQFIAEAKRGRK